MTASDPFVTYDAAYVLGALSPEDRQEFEEHLLGCARCSAAVREMSVIPGVLSRTGPPPAPDEPPAGLLTDVLRRVRRGRRIRNTVTAVSASVAVAAVVALGVTTFPGPAAPPSTAMTALGTFPVRADAERQPSIAIRRATVNSQARAEPCDWSSTALLRHARRSVSWTTSSARMRSPEVR